MHVKEEGTFTYHCALVD